ncbi:MAG: GyrI-like domain-containing protein [Fimbriimonadales bacterium]
MNAQVIQIAPIPVVMLRHVGSYDEVGPVFDQLWNWTQAQGIPTERTIGVYWDDPDEVPAARLRSAACFEIPLGYQIADRSGLQVEVTDIAGGTYVTTRFVGPYENLAPVWNELEQYVENTVRRQISSNPAFEIYVNDASDTPADQLITELYMPVV